MKCKCGSYEYEECGNDVIICLGCGKIMIKGQK